MWLFPACIELEPLKDTGSDWYIPGTSSCGVIAERPVLSKEVVHELGFSPSELSWLESRLQPWLTHVGTGRQTLATTEVVLSGTARFLDYGDCPDVLAVDGTLSVTTQDGTINQTWTHLFTASSAGKATFVKTSKVLAGVEGTAPFTTTLDFEPTAVSGEIVDSTNVAQAILEMKWQ